MAFFIVFDHAFAGQNTQYRTNIYILLLRYVGPRILDRVHLASAVFIEVLFEIMHSLRCTTFPIEKLIIVMIKRLHANVKMKLFISSEFCKFISNSRLRNTSRRRDLGWHAARATTTPSRSRDFCPDTSTDSGFLP